MPCKDKTKTCKFPLKNNVLLVSPSPQIHEHKTANIAAVSLEIFSFWKRKENWLKIKGEGRNAYKWNPSIQIIRRN